MKKYKKITEEQVLQAYFDLTLENTIENQEKYIKALEKFKKY